jgi:hypothetical protein
MIHPFIIYLFGCRKNHLEKRGYLPGISLLKTRVFVFREAAEDRDIRHAEKHVRQIEDLCSSSIMTPGVL